MNMKRKQRCPVCGNIFMRSKITQVCCSDPCRRSKATITNRSYVHSDYVGNNIYSREADRKLPPNVDEIIETVNILKDFGITQIDIMPKFISRAELYRWRRELINAALT